MCAGIVITRVRLSSGGQACEDGEEEGGTARNKTFHKEYIKGKVAEQTGIKEWFLQR